MKHDIAPLLTLCLAVGLGAILTTLSRRWRLPTIVLLLLGGFLLGPEVLNWVQPSSLHEMFTPLISIAVAIILFEGGLTLNIGDFLRSSQEIRRLLTVGVLITWLVGAFAIWLVFRWEISFCLLAGSLVIVTGPTVIVPLLKRIQLNSRVASILHWEGVLIDAIGVFVAILCFEWVVGNEGGWALGRFLLRVASGMAFGLAGGFLVSIAIRREWVPEQLVNGFTLAAAVLLFGLTELVIAEAGLLTVTVAGLVVGWKAPLQLKEIRAFKGEIVDLLIGALFLLLVARLELEQFAEFGLQGILLLAIVLFVIRPLSVLVCTWGGDLEWREKAFLGWVAPRGIVAASMASLFAISLSGQENPPGDPGFLETFTYSVIAATVLVQGFSAGLVANVLKLRRPQPTGWLIIGAHAFGRHLAGLLKGAVTPPLVLVDTNARNIARAKADGLDAFDADALEADAMMEEPRFATIGSVLALTDNGELNELLMQRWGEARGRSNVNAWRPSAGGVSTRGRDVFAGLPRPSVLATELENGEARLSLTDPIQAGTNRNGSELLAIIRQGRLILPSRQDEQAPVPKEGDRLLLLERSGSTLQKALKRGKFFQAEAENIEKLYQSLVDKALAVSPNMSRNELVADLDNQSRLFPSLLGHGIAIAHVYSKQLTSRICLFIRAEPPVACEGQEDPIRSLFFVMSPTGDAEGHLDTLSDIGGACRDKGRRKAIHQATTIDEVIAATGE